MMYEPDDRITLWHVECGGRAMAVKPYWLDGGALLRAEDVDQQGREGKVIRCQTCGEPLAGGNVSTKRIRCGNIYWVFTAEEPDPRNSRM